MTGRVAVITGGSQGIGAGLVAGVPGAGLGGGGQRPHDQAVAGPRSAHRRRRTSAEPATADRIIDAALERFGRIDTLVNNAGVFISKPFTDYTAADYALVIGVNLAGFFWLTQRVIAEMASRYGGHVVNITATLAEVRGLRRTRGAGRADQGRPGRGHQVAGHRVRLLRHPGQRRLAGHHRDPVHPAESYDDLGDRLPRSGGPARSATSSTASCSWSHRPTSPARSCTSTAARSPVTEARG